MTTTLVMIGAVIAYFIVAIHFAAWIGNVIKEILE
jgi:hypothetical protein